eukprot:TRINITY_DN2032_c0_g1_i5.p1 TRINITY_DN2032_c0_g1~~TRINITY_DN2032_c0_g1_i5.p1  ORF type:complete len:199 (-),score=51.52 TRINITY_DN2032_c0_g1_i5:272-868(-)
MATLKTTNVCKVFAILLLKSDGSRLYSEYYTKLASPGALKTTEGNLDQIDNQIAFEKNIYEKSKKLTSSKTSKSTDTEIFTYGSFIVLFKVLNDLSLFVLGEFEENEMLLQNVINSIFEAMGAVTKNVHSKKSYLDNFEHLVLIIDEITDEGVIVTLEPGIIYARATMKDTESVNLNQQEQANPSSNAFSMVVKSLRR